jgi:predicted site-specific integrase-resolvase
MKLSAWAKKQGISYVTAYRWFRGGKIPGATQYDSGTILVPEENKTVIDAFYNKCFIYCRVSNQSRKKELEYQVRRCEEFASARGIIVEKIYKEVASGMNDKRRELIKMLDNNPKIILIENKDRLTRFGFNYLENLLTKLGCQIIVMNENHEDEHDLMKDLVSIITSFCCRLYGLRRTKNKVNKIKEVLNEQD